MIANKSLQEIGKIQTIQAKDKLSNDKYNMRQELFVSYSPFQIQGCKKNNQTYMATEQQQANQRRLFSQQLMNQRNKIDGELNQLGFQSKEQLQKYGIVTKQNNQYQNEISLDQDIFEFNDFQIDHDAFNNLSESQTKLLESSKNSQRGDTRKQSKAQTATTLYSNQLSDTTSRQYMSTLSLKERNTIYQRRDEIEKAYFELLKLREERQQRKKVLQKQYSDEIEANLIEKMKEYKSINQRQNEEIDKFNLKIKEKYAQYKLRQRQLEIQIQQQKETNLQQEIDQRNREIIQQMREQSIVRRKFTVNNEKVQIRRLEYQRDQIHKLIEEKQKSKEDATSRAQQLMINKEICQLYYEIEKINKQLFDISYYRNTHQEDVPVKNICLISEANMRQICKGQINTARMMDIVNVVQGNADEQEHLIQTQQTNKLAQQEQSEEEKKYMNIQVKEAHEIFSYTQALSGIIDTYNQLLENYVMQLNSLEEKPKEDQDNVQTSITNEQQDEPLVNSKINAYETILNTIKPVEKISSNPIVHLIPDLESPEEKPKIGHYQLISKSFDVQNAHLMKHLANMSMPVQEKKHIEDSYILAVDSNSAQVSTNETCKNSTEIQNDQQIDVMVDKVIQEPEVTIEQSNTLGVQILESDKKFSMSLGDQINSDTQQDPAATTASKSTQEQAELIDQPIIKHEPLLKGDEQNETSQKDAAITQQQDENKNVEQEAQNNQITITNETQCQEEVKKLKEQSDEQLKEPSNNLEKAENQTINAYNIISTGITSSQQKQETENAEYTQQEKEASEQPKQETQPEEISNQQIEVPKEDNQDDESYEYENDEPSCSDQNKHSVIYNAQIQDSQTQNIEPSNITAVHIEATEDTCTEQFNKSDYKILQSIASIILESQEEADKMYCDILNGYSQYFSEAHKQ